MALQSLIDFFFPPDPVIPELLTGLRKLTPTPVILSADDCRKANMPALDGVVGAAEYRREKLLKKAVPLFKYRRVEAVSDTLVRLMTQASRHLPASSTLCPVPLHWTRKFSRGFNQCEVLARGVGRERGLGVREFLRRTRSTGSQVGRDRSERLTALNGAFVVKNGIELPECVVLVDDLCTTGATLNECANALKRAGAKMVFALVAAVD